MDVTEGETLAQAEVNGTDFNAEVELLRPGANPLEIQIIDRAGNITITEIEVFADLTKPTILEFNNLPANNNTEPVNSIDVRFSEQINLETFDYTDIELSRNGQEIAITDVVEVELIENKTYRISGLETLTETVGVYSLEVDATTIEDNAGNSGTVAESVIFTVDEEQINESNLDIDGNGILELQDYNLIDLYAGGLDAAEFDFLLNNFTNDLIGEGATRADSDSILNYLNEVGDSLFDIDDNNIVELQDYNLIDLYAGGLDQAEFGFLLENYPNDLIGEGAIRTDAASILDHFETIVPPVI